MDDMTYSESAKGVVIGRERAVAELVAHGVTKTQDQFEGLSEARRPDGKFSAYALLQWLGY